MEVNTISLPFFGCPKGVKIVWKREVRGVVLAAIGVCTGVKFKA